MSVHALFRMARCLYPIAPQTGSPAPSPAPPASVPAPPTRASQVFRPSHALYSSITSRHASLQRARAAWKPPADAQAAKTPAAAPKSPDSVSQEAT